jgi:ribosomal protein S18 acetylase RimI-like enzyme
MAVRRASESEWQQARELRLRALGDTPDAFLRSQAEESRLPESEWRDRLAERSDRAWIVEAADSGRFAGMVVVAFRGADADTASLFGMWVEPGQRRRGIGRRLVEAAVDWARAAGAKRVELEVNEAMEPAAALYRACGFVPTGRRQLRKRGLVPVQMMREV